MALPVSARRLAFRIAAVVGGTVAVLVALELTLHVSPALWPRGNYGVPRYDRSVGLVLHGGTAVYDGSRSLFRTPNSSGFLDLEHQGHKAVGWRRVGVFGDSFVEAMQVHQSDTFVVRLGERLAEERIEVLGFGISGWGTLHSLLAHRVLGSKYDLDFVVYSFCKNDPADHYLPLTDGRWPKAELQADPPGFHVVDKTQPPDPTGVRNEIEFAIDRYLMLPRLIRSRLLLLQTEKLEAERAATGAWERNALRSQWPADAALEGEMLTGRILEQFHREVEARGARFAVLYTPDADAELSGLRGPEDSWRPWLERTCDRLGIPFIDPSAALIERREHEPVFGDHYEPAGHEVVAAALQRFLDSTGFSDSSP